MIESRQRHGLISRIDLMSSFLSIPFSDGGILMEIFNDLPPSNACVIGAEGDFSFLRSVRNDAHFGAAEIIVEEILEPHAGHEHEVPAVLLSLFSDAVIDFTSGDTPSGLFVEFTNQIEER